MSLARRFLLANLAILLVGGVTIGIWVGDQLERGIIDRTSSITALYVESFIEPPIESLATGQWLAADDTAALDSLLNSTALGERIVALKIWSPDGVVLYSADHELVGQRFPIEGGLAQSLTGRITAQMSPLDEAENVLERQQFDHLLEMYVPVRERGADRIIAVAEFYQSPVEIDREVADARLRAWAIVGLGVLVSYLLLYGIVRQGSDTISRQRAALESQVRDLTWLVDQNEALNERVRQAAERTTTLGERALRRISSDLHDGPGQMLSLALMRLDALRRRSSSAENASPGASTDAAHDASRLGETAKEQEQVEAALRDALRDMRTIAAGLRLPELEPLTAREVAERAVADHQRRSGSVVQLIFDDAPGSPPDVLDLAVKITLFRALQELLSNGTRHGTGREIAVRLGVARGPGLSGRVLRLRVSDRGPGFDVAALEDMVTGAVTTGAAISGGLGLAGVREAAELLGGGFEIESTPGAGTAVDVWWPIGGAAYLPGHPLAPGEWDAGLEGRP
jgi:signal transduction histidine kinase